jgi:hypothetical protein
LIEYFGVGEPTTMAGRRLRSVYRSLSLSKFSLDFVCREAVHARLVSSGIFDDEDDETHVVIVGTANTYAHYITTREEYAVQRCVSSFFRFFWGVG